MAPDVLRTALQPRHLIELALRDQWLALSLALLGLVLVLAAAGFRVRISPWAQLAPLTWRVPLYLWAMCATLRALETFGMLAVSHPPPAIKMWAVALSQGIALFAVVVLTCVSAVVASHVLRVTVAPAVGPIAAVGAVSADWLFLLLFFPAIH